MYSIEYSLPYIALFLFFLIISFFENKNKNLISNFSLLLFIIFIGFRGYIGWDWYSYTEVFDRIIPFFNSNSSDNFAYFDTGLYPGFTIIISIFKIFSDSYIFFILFLTIVSGFSFKTLFVKYNINVSLGFALLILFGLNIQIDLLRNNLSIIFFLFSLDSLLKRKKISFFVLNIIGVTIHLSSIFFLPLYFVLHKRIKTHVLILSVVGVYIYFTKVNFEMIINKLSFLISEDIQTKLEVYSSIESLFASDVNVLLFLLKIFFLVIITYFYDKIISSYPKLIVFLNLALLNILSFLYFSSFNVLHSRLQYLFVLSFIFCIPHIYMNLYKTRFFSLRKSILFLFVIFQCFSMTQRYGIILFKYENNLFNWDNLYERTKIFDNNAYEIQPLK